MKVFLVGNVEEPVASLLKKQGFEIVPEPPECRDCFILYVDNCDAAVGLGFGCLTKEELFRLVEELEPQRL